MSEQAREIGQRWTIFPNPPTKVALKLLHISPGYEGRPTYR